MKMCPSCGSKRVVKVVSRHNPHAFCVRCDRTWSDEVAALSGSDSPQSAPLHEPTAAGAAENVRF